MATASLPEVESRSEVLVEPRRFTVDEYYRMAEAGVLARDERVELIEGKVFTMRPISDEHAACVNGFVELFGQHVNQRALVSVQNPIRIGERTEPQPDIVLARPRKDRYRSGHPKPQDLFLVIEVMHTSAPMDRDIKLPLYARAGIPEVWLVDLPGELIEVHRQPISGVYTERVIRLPGQTVSPEAFADVELSVADILGRSES